VGVGVELLDAEGQEQLVVVRATEAHGTQHSPVFIFFPIRGLPVVVAEVPGVGHQALRELRRLPRQHHLNTAGQMHDNL
jgi:hypothetical protein